jgi:2-polyprenyl-6-methoxyphenol hydroxylase-like FAD-dependent oxidoreductase
MAHDTSVLIAGGSLNGLTTALLLAERRVPCLVVERHPGTTLQYKFRGISPRSMEIYRSLGIEDEIRARDLIDEASASIGRMTNLSATDISWQGIAWPDTGDLGPTKAATCDQDQLEPILRDHAQRRGADVRFNTELLTFAQTGDRITARIRDRETGRESDVRASYLVAADGTDSPIRQSLKIGRHGPGVVQHWMNVIFETDLPTTLQARAIRSIFVTDINGTFVPRGDGRWLMAVQYVPDRGETPADFTEAFCRDLIRRGAGRADVRVDIIDARPWDATAAVADRFVDGRVFLVGDSAHVMPPTGGFGGNTGIQDAWNLAWKLDLVLQGAAAPQLLDTYDTERRPVADHTMAQALARLQAWFRDPSNKLPPAVPIVDDNAVMFGYRYLSGAFVAGRGAGENLFDDPRAPSGQPGSRAPQLVVEHDGRRVSTIDLFAGRWVVLGGPEGDAWPDIARDVSAAAALDLGSYSLGPAGALRDVDGRWHSAFGLGPRGAVLIRPDGFIAWCAQDSGPGTEAALEQAFERLNVRGTVGRT